MRIIIAASALSAAIASTATLAIAADVNSSWSYEGETGPHAWHELDTDHAACAGAQQSPIDLVATHVADNETITPDWSAFTPEIVNNGHTFQANVPEGNTTEFGDATYTLLQVHFHHLSEHTIDGNHSPLEAHLVHSGDDGSLMVLGIMIEEGEANDVIGKIWSAAPAEVGKAMADGEIDLATLLPEDRDHFRYSGSLTTPPCTEVVHWVVFSQPVTASKEQIAAFEQAFGRNNRPVQSLNRRFVLHGN